MMDNTPVRNTVLLFTLEEYIPETTSSLIDKHIDFGSFASTQGQLQRHGRPSVDPELLLRILLIGYLYGITASANWWKSWECIWPGAGSRLGSISRFRITRPFPRTGMVVSRNRICSGSSLKR